MTPRAQTLFPALLGGIGLSMALMAAIWVFWPQTTPPKNVSNRQRPPQPTIQQAPQSDANAEANAQFWLEDQANAYARQLENASGENRRALEALLNQTLAEIAALKVKQGQQVRPSPSLEPGHLVSVQSPKN